jgi:ubiquinone/menaquinone biosynthesis C-methylase UbiE
MIFKKIADNSNPDSLATRFRKKRFELFISLLSGLNRSITILDVGGTEQFWRMMGFVDSDGIDITLLNVNEYKTSSSSVKSVKGDALDLEFPDSSFDVVFSNSVIEHVGTFENQKRMAEEIKRVGKRYFVQTPNKYFIIEPHFLFPCFQFLPKGLRAWLVMNFKMGWFKREPSAKRARDLVESITLLTKKEVLMLFPNSKLYEEKLFGMTKSFIAYWGWD